MKSGELQQATAPAPAPMISDSELDIAITTAKKYERDTRQCLTRIREQVFADEETARACWYIKPVGKQKNEETGKFEMMFAQGPSIRFAEIAVSAWGNMRTACGQDPHTGTQVIGKAVVHDLESNTMHQEEVRKSIVNKQGKQYDPSGVANAGLAAQSIAFRNCVMRVIGSGRLKAIADDVEALLKGKMGKLDGVQMKAKIDNAIAYFASKQIDESGLCWLLGVTNRDAIAVPDLMQAGRIKTAIDEGSTDAAELLSDYYAEMQADKSANLDDPDGTTDPTGKVGAIEF